MIMQENKEKNRIDIMFMRKKGVIKVKIKKEIMLQA